VKDGRLDPESDVVLLRRFEPVMRFTKGERFYPLDVEPYVRACGLWVHRAGGQEEAVVPRGKLTLENLGRQPEDGPGAVHYLRFTEPRDIRELYYRGSGSSLKRGRRVIEDLRSARKNFRVGRGRLARVGYVSRFADALYSVALLARGRVPGESAYAASVAYGRITSERDHYNYHGRVLRQDGWLVLQYWLFYPFNDWRSGFFGANDHEADWEKVMVFLSESEGGEVRPEWTAYAAHEYTGDNLRRRWDDPELEKVGEHPVVHVGAGSHASFYSPGEYLTELELNFPAPIARTTDRMRRFWRRTLRQYAGEAAAPDRDGAPGSFVIPFVDYARGDGLSVGPGGDREWDPPRLIGDPVPDWVSGYRGLWGLYTRDPFKGEDAPAGPMYDRGGGPDRAWYDPVGWAGLDKVPDPTEELGVVLGRQAEVAARRARLRAEIEEKGRELRGLGVEVAALREHSDVGGAYEVRRARLVALSGEVDRLRKREAADETVLETLAGYAGRLRAGEREPARAHISRAHTPASDVEIHTSRVAEVWAAVSVSLALICLVAIIVFEREHLMVALVASIAVFAFVEAGFKGRLTKLVSSVNVGLAVVAALILAYEFFWQMVILGVLTLGLYVLWDNLRELRR
jgi:hypothetical protein